MSIGFYHHHKRTSKKKSPQVSQKKLISVLDGGVYFTGIFTVLIFIPQFVDVWFSNKIVGVSLLSWTGLFISSIFWMFYGVVHKTKPLIFINVLSGIIQFLIILGILLHR